MPDTSSEQALRNEQATGNKWTSDGQQVNKRRATSEQAVGNECPKVKPKSGHYHHKTTKSIFIEYKGSRKALL